MDNNTARAIQLTDTQWRIETTESDWVRVEDGLRAELERDGQSALTLLYTPESDGLIQLMGTVIADPDIKKLPPSQVPY